MNRHPTAIQPKKREHLRQMIVVSFVVGLLCALFSPLTLLRAEEGTRTHIVTPGESLSAIATRYGVSVASLVQANGITNPNLLTVGQALLIPLAAPPMNITQPVSAPRATVPSTDDAVPAESIPHTIDMLYTVYPGETLSSIAARYGTTSSAIKARNGLLTTTIYAGQRLIIPATIRPLVPVATRQPIAPSAGRPLPLAATPASLPVRESPLILLPTAPPTGGPHTR